MRKCDYPLLCNRFTARLRFSRVLTTIAYLSWRQEGDRTSTKLPSSLNDNRLLLDFFSWKKTFFEVEKEKSNWKYNHVVQPTVVDLFENNKTRSLNNTHVHKFSKIYHKTNMECFYKFLILFVVFEDSKLQSHGLWWKKRKEFPSNVFEIWISRRVNYNCAWKRWLEL